MIFPSVPVRTADEIPERGEELVYLLPGFSTKSGIKVGEIFKEATELAAPNDLSAPPILFQSSIPGNKSEFTICLRIRAHYQRPEIVLVTAYAQNKTSLVIGNYNFIKQSEGASFLFMVT